MFPKMSDCRSGRRKSKNPLACSVGQIHHKPCLKKYLNLRSPWPFFSFSINFFSLFRVSCGCYGRASFCFVQILGYLFYVFVPSAGCPRLTFGFVFYNSLFYVGQSSMDFVLIALSVRLKTPFPFPFQFQFQVPLPNTQSQRPHPILKPPHQYHCLFRFFPPSRFVKSKCRIVKISHLLVDRRPRRHIHKWMCAYVRHPFHRYINIYIPAPFRRLLI